MVCSSITYYLRHNNLKARDEEGNILYGGDGKAIMKKIGTIKKRPRVCFTFFSSINDHLLLTMLLLRDVGCTWGDC